jgi:hypothetical protein
VKVESPCYELHKVPLEVTNPFPQGGDFKIVLLETKEDSVGSQTSLIAQKKKKSKKIRSKINTGVNKSEEDKEEILQSVVEPMTTKMEKGQVSFHSDALYK